jgi:hypothetical protein
MNHLSESSAHQVYECYADIERRLQEVVRVLPFVHADELRRIRSHRLASILLESASLIDAVLRHHLPENFVRANGKTATRDRANFSDYRAQLDGQLQLSNAKSLLLFGVPALLTPFEEWRSNEKSPDWWRK